MLEKVGFVILVLGLMMCESESMLIPAGVITLGFTLVWLGVKLEARHEKR